MTQHAPLIIDIAGLELTDLDRRRLAHPLVGGVILFTRNWEHRAQLQALTATIKSVRADLLICVDHEGGRVQRFQGDGLTHLPAMRVLGDMWQKDSTAASNVATAAGFVLASELRACGVDFSFTPVLDLDWGASQVIGSRAFHRSSPVVTALARALMLGLLQAGMGNCGKHFPGHGHVQADSHTELPVDTRNLEAILAEDGAPYAGLTTALTAVMPAHVIYPAVDDKPAGFSATWLHGILRERMRFQGAIISDDLDMQAARCIHGTPISHTEAALHALHAGCDLVLLCNQSQQGGGESLDALLEGLVAARQAGRWQLHPRSAERRRALLPRTPAIAWEALMQHPAYLHAKELLP